MSFDPMPVNELRELVGDLCYVFPAVGMTDLAFCLQSRDGTSLQFIQSRSYVDFPRIGFYQMDRDSARYRCSFGVYNSTMNNSPQTIPAALNIVQAFVSVANANRSIREGEVSKQSKDYTSIISTYRNAIRLSGDESAIKMLGLIGDRPDTVMFCSTDDELSSLVPEPLRMTVSEAFAGLALCAMHEGRVYQCVGYGTAALFKHRSALPMFNCCRLVAAGRQDMMAVLYLTEMVLMPFYIRTGSDELFNKELELWGPEARKHFSKLSQSLATTAASLQARFAGRYGVIRAKFKGTSFVEKLCRICGKGSNGEKVRSCSVCKRVYYCSKECQVADWRAHRVGCHPA